MYKCSTPYESASKAKIGILITNLGTPDSPTKGSLKTYLKEFLSDTRVVEPPPARWIWKLILNVIILNIRPKKSAQAYETVWGEFGEGSPLLDISKYPQYASATTGSTFDAVSDEIKTWRKVPELKFISHYYNDQRYIDALASSVNEFQTKHGKPDLLLMSYHGIPKRYFNNGDSYPCHCCKTTHLLAKKLDVEPSTYKMSFQSRFGREEWMRDYTDETLKSLPKKDIKNVQIICPGFSADCLETIEEIEEENKDYFIEAGGESYQYIPALNTREDHIACLSGIVYDKTKDWSDQ